VWRGGAGRGGAWSCATSALVRADGCFERIAKQESRKRPDSFHVRLTFDWSDAKLHQSLFPQRRRDPIQYLCTSMFSNIGPPTADTFRPQPQPQPQLQPPKKSGYQAPTHARVPNAQVHATAHSHQRGPIERSGCRRAALTRRTVQRLVPTPTAWPVVSPCLLLGVAAVDEPVDVRAKVRADNWSPGSDPHVRTGVARPRVGTGSECTLQSCWLLDLCAVQSVNDGPAARDGAAAIVRSHACRRKSC
jgi:hypothetical protein